MFLHTTEDNYREDEPSNTYVFKLLSKLSQTCEPTGRQAKLCDEPKRENGVKNMICASQIDVQAAEEYARK